MRKSIMEQSADTAVMILELSKLTRGTVIPYEKFSEWLGRPVKRSIDLPTINTVIQRLKKDYGLVLDSIKGEGYRILSHEEVVKDESRTQRIRRMAKKRRQELVTVELSELDELGKLQWAAKSTQSYLIAEAASEKSVAKIAAACNGATEPLALSKALDAIKANIK